MMAARRLSRLQKRIVRWLVADYQRTQGQTTSSHLELVLALQGDKSNMSHSLRTLEAHGLITMARSPGGKAESLFLTPQGYQVAVHLTGSCD